MLFIVIHQVQELWIKLCLHETMAAMEHIKADQLGPVSKMLSRVAQIQGQLLSAWGVLSTMTPSDYAKFRDSLGQSSGFQSYQYRALEFALGNKNKKMTEVHRKHPEKYKFLSDVLNAPSIYDLTLGLLQKRGLNIPETVTSRDWKQPYESNDHVTAAWLEVYRNTEKHWDLYELAEKLVDLETRFQQWRFFHLKTVERIIGFKRGTGGTSGVEFLRRALDLRFFPELISVRTDL
jgi:tryptophan 2,3-dioxygenase